jgi:hypothetical protein
MRKKPSRNPKAGLHPHDRMLEMLNHDFSAGWENDWERSGRTETAGTGTDEVVPDAEAWNEVVEANPSAKFCDLNETQARECQQILRQYVDGWLDGGCDVAKWRQRQQFLVAVNARRAYLGRESDGRAWLYFDSPSADAKPAESWAVQLFLPYITGDHFTSVGRCHRCGTYYPKPTRRRDRKYCSTKCSKYTFSVKYTREARRKEREAKLKEAGAAIRSFDSLEPKKRMQSADWKAYVVRAVNKRSGPRFVTRNFITKAVKQGQLTPPKGFAS